MELQFLVDSEIFEIKLSQDGQQIITVWRILYILHLVRTDYHK